VKESKESSLAEDYHEVSSRLTLKDRLKGTLKSLARPVKVGIIEVILVIAAILLVIFLFRGAPPANYEKLEPLLKAVIDVSGVAIGLTGVVSVFLLNSTANAKRDTNRYLRELKSRLRESPEKDRQLSVLILNEQKGLDTLAYHVGFTIALILICVFIFIAASISSMANMAAMESGKMYNTIHILSLPLTFLITGFLFLAYVVISGSFFVYE